MHTWDVCMYVCEKQIMYIQLVGICSYKLHVSTACHSQRMVTLGCLGIATGARSCFSCKTSVFISFTSAV